MNAFTKSRGRSTASTLRRILPYAAACIGLTLSAQAFALESSLPPNGVLLVGQRLVDQNCYYHLEMQPDANLVLYAGAGETHPIWSDNQSGHTGGPSGSAVDQAYVINQLDGNFVEYVPAQYTDWPATAIWASNTDSGKQNVLEMQPDGNLVLYPEGVPQLASTALWWSGTDDGFEPPNNNCEQLSSYTLFQENMQISAGTQLPNSTYAATWNACGEICVQTVGCTAFQFEATYNWEIPQFCNLYTGAPTVSPVRVGVESIVGTVTNSY